MIKIQIKLVVMKQLKVIHSLLQQIIKKQKPSTSCRRIVHRRPLTH